MEKINNQWYLFFLTVESGHLLREKNIYTVSKGRKENEVSMNVWCIKWLSHSDEGSPDNRSDTFYRH